MTTGSSRPPAGDGQGRPPAQRAGPPRYDSLLTRVMNHTLDEEYSEVAGACGRHPEEPTPPRGARLSGLAAVLAMFGLLVGVSALRTQEDKPGLEAERDELVDQIAAQQARLDDVQSAITDARAEITVLQQDIADAVNSSEALQRRLETLGYGAGTTVLEGPGLTLTVDDAPGATGNSGGVIRDRDLQSLVNGLWAAGAEAVAVNGYRLTGLTAIRFAGEAITVDYRSLSPPYVIEVIGNPDTLPARFSQTEGGQLWASLEVNFDIGFDYEEKDSIVVPGDPHEHLAYAVQADR